MNSQLRSHFKNSPPCISQLSFGVFTLADTETDIEADKMGTVPLEIGVSVCMCVVWTLLRDITLSKKSVWRVGNRCRSMWTHSCLNCHKLLASMHIHVWKSPERKVYSFQIKLNFHAKTFVVMRFKIDRTQCDEIPITICKKSKGNETKKK